jgi:hypothetical protein
LLSSSILNDSIVVVYSSSFAADSESIPIIKMSFTKVLIMVRVISI